MNRRTLRHSALIALTALMVLGLALFAPHAPWSGSARAESDRAAISRSGVLGGARYLIEVPAKWQGGLVVYAHGIQRGSGPGTVGPPPIGHHILAGGHAWVASGYRASEYQPQTSSTRECGGCIRRRTPDHRARTPCTRNAPVS